MKPENQSFHIVHRYLQFSKQNMKNRIEATKISNRYAASVIDYGIFVTLDLIYIFNFGEPNNEGGYTMSGLPALIPIIAWVIYFPIIESINGQTLGHKLLGIKVVTLKGNEISFKQSFKRRILDLIDAQFFGIIAVIIIKNTPTNQRLGDLWSKTLVIGKTVKRCQFCHEKLELEHKEIILNRFKCPICGRINE